MEPTAAKAMEIEEAKRKVKETMDRLCNTPKPVGRFRCMACGHEWDGRQVLLDPSTAHPRWTCADVFCGANVRPVMPGA